MSRVLCTMPGRAGDILWALPSVRAISEYYQTSVCLQIAGEFESMCLLLLGQSYIAQVLVDHRWSLAQDGKQSPEPMEGPYDAIYHLAYTRWPEEPLPYEIQRTMRDQQEQRGESKLWMDLERPWITVDAPPHLHATWTCGFTEAHFELKYGLWELLSKDQGLGPLSLCTGSRWKQEAEHGGCTWLEAAQWIAASKVFFGDCSALHVLAVALGKPVVLMEPMEARWNEIFYPLGKSGPQVRLVTGNDGKPTFDARHCADALKEALGHAR
jgi:hypothetical protein